MSCYDPPKRNQELVAHYERLRADVLSLPPSAAMPAGSPGLALYLRRGMAAWMCAWSRCMHDTGFEAGVLLRVSSPPCPVETREQITNILAAMILGREQEAFR